MKAKGKSQIIYWKTEGHSVSGKGSGAGSKNFSNSSLNVSQLSYVESEHWNIWATPIHSDWQQFT